MSIRDLELEFPFWSIATINRAIQSLEGKALVFIENFNERKYDKTRWFAINPDEAGKLRSIAIKCPDNEPLKAGKAPDEPSSPPPSEGEKDGGHETRSTQNETGSAQFETRSTQFETTI